MPTVPDKRALGQIRVNGRATPEQINPAVAYDIGRAGAAMNQAMQQIAGAFAGLGAKQEAMQDAAWLSQAKIDTMTADDAIRRETELNAGADGTGYDQAPLRFKAAAEEVEQRPGGSAEARMKYKLWSAEQGYETGRWAAGTAQKKLQEHTNTGLTKRLDELTTLSGANPDKALDYYKAYEEEVDSKVGYAISPADAEERKFDAKTRIVKESVITRAKVDPAGFGRAVKALEESGAAPKLFSDVNTETRGLTQAPTGKHPSYVSSKLETGHEDPLKGVSAINTNDSGGSHSYGNFGINSGGSAQQFKAMFGKQFGLTAEPGTAAFDKQWRNAAGAAPVELHQAELEWWDKTIGSKVTNNLKGIGVSADMARDARVLAYFADRSVQQGPGSTANHAGRIMQAFKKADGSVEKFLSNMSTADRGKLGTDFPTALATGAYSADGHDNRLEGRERRSLAVGPGGVPAPQVIEGDRSKAPQLPGNSIQPGELLELSNKDYDAITRELRPHLVSDMENRMQKAVASLATTGKQDIIKPGELDDMRGILAPKDIDNWKKSLRDTGEMYVVVDAAKRMSPSMRQAQLSALVPTGRVEDLTEDETRRFEMWRGAIKSIDTAIQKDPLGYFAVEHESGRQAMKEIAGAETGEAGTPAREKAYDTLIKLQKDQGLPLNDIRILGEDQAQRVANQLKEAKTGPAAMLIVEDMRKTFGKHFNQLWGELVNQGAPQSYLALRTATRQGQDALVQSYSMENAMAEGGKGSGRKGMLAERAGIKQTELSKAVSDEISQFTIALEHGASSTKLIEGYRTAAERVTAYHVIQGKDLKDAAKQAADELFGKNLKVIEGALVPTHVAERGGDTIQRSLRNMASSIEADREMIVPPLRANRGLPADNNQTAYIERLKSNHKFVTREDSTGVYMLDEHDEYVLIDTENGLAPWSRTWEELEKMPRPDPWYLRGPTFPGFK